MSASQHARRNWLAVVFALFIGFGCGYLSRGAINFISGLGPEYESADIIRKVTDFVSRNKAWPTSWKDLGSPPRDTVSVNWPLDVMTCDRYDVMTAVSPMTGSFYTYPHAEQQLVDLWHLVLTTREERSDQAVNPSGGSGGF